jgi:uncharacterized protein (TIGR00369 family)
MRGAEIMRQFLPTSPFVGHLGMRLAHIGPDTATMILPFDERVLTIGTTVHGGAIASLIDTVAMVAAWSNSERTESLRGSTVGMTVNYLAPAVSEDVRAVATVLRRGRSLVYLDVEARIESGALVAKGLVTYKIG